jgi:hypothetical protein
VTNTRRRPWLFDPLLVAVGIGVLASCTPPPKPAPPPVQTVEAPPPPRHHPHRRFVPRPPHKPQPPPEEMVTSPEEGSATFAMLGAAPAANVQPHQLIGLDEAATAQLFGAATVQSSQPPAKVWRYQTASCELDLYFYYDLRSARMRTLRYSFKGSANNPEEQQQCIDALAARRRG